MAEGGANSRDGGGDYLSTKGGGGIGNSTCMEMEIISRDLLSELEPKARVGCDA